MEKRVIGSSIKSVIMNRGIQMKDIAERLGISKQNLNYYLNGKSDRLWKKYEVRQWGKKLGLRTELVEKLQRHCGVEANESEEVEVWE